MWRELPAPWKALRQSKKLPEESAFLRDSFVPLDGSKRPQRLRRIISPRRGCRVSEEIEAWVRIPLDGHKSPLSDYSTMRPHCIYWSLAKCSDKPPPKGGAGDSPAVLALHRFCLTA